MLTATNERVFFFVDTVVIITYFFYFGNDTWAYTRAKPTINGCNWIRCTNREMIFHTLDENEQKKTIKLRTLTSHVRSILSFISIAELRTDIQKNARHLQVVNLQTYVQLTLKINLFRDPFDVCVCVFVFFLHVWRSDHFEWKTKWKRYNNIKN